MAEAEDLATDEEGLFAFFVLDGKLVSEREDLLLHDVAHVIEYFRRSTSQYGDRATNRSDSFGRVCGPARPA
jgi:hypothetical protein